VERMTLQRYVRWVSMTLESNPRQTLDSIPLKWILDVTIKDGRFDLYSLKTHRANTWNGNESRSVFSVELPRRRHIVEFGALAYG